MTQPSGSISSKASIAIFLDRDGTINRNYPEGPIYKVELFELLPRSAQAIRILNDMDLPLYVVTNQGGINHRDHDFGWHEYYRIEKKMYDYLFLEAGAHVDDVFICHHAEYEKCACRKPQIGLLQQAQEKYGFIPENSFMVGDSVADVLAGCCAGVRTILVRSGWQNVVEEELRVQNCLPNFVVEDLYEAAILIKSLVII